MKRPKHELAEQELEILELIESGMIVSEIAQRVACTRQYVYRIAKRNEVTPKSAPRGPRRMSELHRFSLLHEKIGRKVTKWRLDNKYSYGQARMYLNLPNEAIQRAEYGGFNFTLTQLQKIAEVLGVSLVELLGGKDEHSSIDPN